MKSSYKNNPYLLFLPILLLYLIIIFVKAEDILKGDEGRYLFFAENLTNGFYSPPPPDINLTNGPGYPIVLTPFKAIHLPLISFKLLNAVFLFLAAIYFYKTLLLYTKQKTAQFTAVLFGLYFFFTKNLPYVYSVLTEAFSVFLMTLFAYSFCSLLREKKPKLIKALVTAFLLGYLALTKIIFGYVISAGIIIFLLYSIILKNKKARLAFVIFILALSFCIPYLIYTYSLTGKTFYWGGGGELLYWMSSLDKSEFGDWRPGHPYETVAYDSLQEKENHRFYRRISKLNFVEKNRALKKEALKNIKKEPKKFLMNWFANISRMLFDYPHSYRPQTLKTYFTMIPNMFIFVLSILFLFITIINHRKIPQDRQLPFERKQENVLPGSALDRIMACLCL
jgi:hypothetical protein